MPALRTLDDKIFGRQAGVDDLPVFIVVIVGAHGMLCAGFDVEVIFCTVTPSAYPPAGCRAAEPVTAGSRCRRTGPSVLPGIFRA